MCKLAKYEITQPTNCQPVRETIVHAIAGQNDSYFSGNFFFFKEAIGSKKSKSPNFFNWKFQHF